VAGESGTSSVSLHLLLPTGTTTATLAADVLELDTDNAETPIRCQADAQLTPSTTHTG
jgi:hypothetical protein